MKGTFDRMIPAQLLRNMRKTQITKQSVKCVNSFISNRTTTLCLLGNNTDSFPT